jgi:uncharacterized damage-inducible protein DinB
MDLIPILLKEMEQEAVTTKKMLGRVPADRFGWKPHPKSMSLQQLATHLAELPSWVNTVLKTDGLDLANSQYKPHPVGSTQDLLDLFEKSYSVGRGALATITEEDLARPWSLRMGDKIISVGPKVEMLRGAFCQTVHHRGQLGVFLRLLDIPIPGSYGPSADELNM